MNSYLWLITSHFFFLLHKQWYCRDAASAELELDQLQEVQLAFQKMDIYSGVGENTYQSLAEAMGWLLQWLKGKADGSSLSSKGYQRFEGVWAGHQVLLQLLLT